MPNTIIVMNHTTLMDPSNIFHVNNPVDESVETGGGWKSLGSQILISTVQAFLQKLQQDRALYTCINLNVF